MTRIGTGREETRWMEEVIREIREIGQEIREEVKKEGREVRKEIRGLKLRLEELEKRWLSEECEAQGEEESEEEERNGRLQREKEIERKRKDREGTARKELVEEEKGESSEGGWSEREWGRDWWEEVESEEERRNEERNKKDEVKGMWLKQEEERNERWKVGFEKGAGERLRRVREGRDNREKGEIARDERGGEERGQAEEYLAERSRARRLAEDREEEVKSRREKREKEAERKVEQERREKEDRKKRNLIWRRVAGEGPRERRGLIENIMERVTGRIIPIRRVVEVTGTDKREIIFTELEEEEDKEEIIGKSNEIWRRWEIGVDEELTMEERAYRHRMVKKAKEERAKGRSVVLTNRRMWIEGKEVRWDEEGDRWRRA